VDAYLDALGMPIEMRNERAKEGRLLAVPADAELAPIVRPAIERAIAAVLPPGYYVKHLTTHVELVDIDPDWRNELLSIARGKGVTNQGIAFKDRPLYTWRNLRFRSKAEMRVAQALDRANILFCPNSMARLGLVPDARENREPDFLVCEAGKWGVLEVHGELWHPPSTAAADHDRARLFKQHGIKVVEAYHATRCYEMPGDVVADFLRIVATAVGRFAARQSARARGFGGGRSEEALFHRSPKRHRWKPTCLPVSAFQRLSSSGGPIAPRASR
jgi:hypothetical protein